jgi:hypothetical protein
MSIIFVFIDGIGLRTSAPDNPFATYAQPHLAALLGCPLVSEQVGRRPHALLSALDATMGRAGLPQSGTGQTALFAGINAAQLVERHQSHFPPTALQATLQQRSILYRGQKYGGSAFANAFDGGYWQAVATRKLRKSASVIAGEGANITFRDVSDLAAGQALSWDITNHVMHQRHPEHVAVIDAFGAGANLARLAQDYAITLYETFLTDLVGHGRGDVSVADVVARIDGLLGGIVAHLRPHDSLVMSSDHWGILSARPKGAYHQSRAVVGGGPAVIHCNTYRVFVMWPTRSKR